jgi:hypothetical protein
MIGKTLAHYEILDKIGARAEPPWNCHRLRFSGEAIGYGFSRMVVACTDVRRTPIMNLVTFLAPRCRYVGVLI